MINGSSPLPFSTSKDWLAETIVIGHLARKDWLDALIFMSNLVKMTKVQEEERIKEKSGRGFNKASEAGDFHVKFRDLLL